ncbi:MAG: hypothetical protein ACOC4G_14050 [Bacillota bacterium]
MKSILIKLISYLLFITMITAFSASFVSSADNTVSQELIINISPYATIDLKSDDIQILFEKPWPGEEIREERTGLILKNNIDVHLSWESSEIINKKTGRTLPLGTWEEQNNSRSIRDEMKPKSFGLTASLIPAGNDLSSLNQESIMGSILRKDNRIESSDFYRFKPGRHELDIVIGYFWAAEGNWFEIHAGDYSGEILYTVSAVND